MKRHAIFEHVVAATGSEADSGQAWGTRFRTGDEPMVSGAPAHHTPAPVPRRIRCQRRCLCRRKQNMRDDVGRKRLVRTFPPRVTPSRMNY